MMPVLDLFTRADDFFLSGLTFLRIFVIGDERMVLPLLNAAMPGFLALVALALILFATSIGLLQVAGSLTTLPLRGPDVHRNFLFIVFLPRPKTVLMASTTGSTLSKSSNIFISMLFIVSAVSVSALVSVSDVGVSDAL
tara:strand:- start:278 stop:694 length:417 start_codon:yes stop_codon:yes gene_type:complete